MNENVLDIDFAALIQSLIRRWWLILGIGIASAGAALVFSLFQPDRYESQAMILFTRTRRELSLAEQFPTFTDPVDTRARMDALLSIADSDIIATQTFASLRGSYPNLIASVMDVRDRASLQTKGDAIIVNTWSINPELAAALANTWAAEATKAINLAFIGEQPTEELDEQLNLALADYEAAQKNLETFLETNELNLLTSYVAQSQTVLDRLTGQSTALIKLYDERRQLMERTINEATALKLQIENGSRSSAAGLGDAIAVLNARLGAFGISRTTERLSSDLQNQSTEFSLVGSDIIIQVNETGALESGSADLAQDLQTIIDHASEEKTKAESEIEQLTQSILSSEDSGLIEETAAQLSVYISRLEAETARELELKSERDLKWSAYQALAQKNVELRNAAPSGERVTIAINAVPPAMPSTSGLIQNTVIAGFLGLTLAAAGVIVRYWWLASKPAETSS